MLEVVDLTGCEPVDADSVHARRTAVGPDLLPRLEHETLVDVKRLHLRLGSAHQLLPIRVGIWVIWPARPLRSDPITGPSSLLRAVPPLCLASVLCPLRCPPLGVLPLVTGGQPSPIHAGRRYRGDRFSTSMPAPTTSSRHLY